MNLNFEKLNTDRGPKRSPKNSMPQKIIPFLLIMSLVLIFVAIYLSFCTPRTLAVPQSITAHGDISITAGELEFNQGYALSSRNYIYWTSSVPWRVTVLSLEPNLGTSDDGQYVKPLSDLHWKLSGIPNWTPIRTDEEVVIESDEKGQGRFQVDYRLLLGWERDRPGTYGTTLRYTISER